MRFYQNLKRLIQYLKCNAIKYVRGPNPLADMDWGIHIQGGPNPLRHRCPSRYRSPLMWIPLAHICQRGWTLFADLDPLHILSYRIVFWVKKKIKIYFKLLFSLTYQEQRDAFHSILISI